jgi:hypothetical protein
MVFHKKTMRFMNFDFLFKDFEIFKLRIFDITKSINKKFKNSNFYDFSIKYYYNINILPNI